MVKDEYDDLSDLTPTDLDEAKEWANNFKCKFLYMEIKMYKRFPVKYPTLGRLLKPGEKPNDYNGEIAKL